MKIKLILTIEKDIHYGLFPNGISDQEILDINLDTLKRSPIYFINMLKDHVDKIKITGEIIV